ncbi:hypothetical protein [Nostoc sp.]|uniref:hypothetical protein n=1 Tax=Nostoc sp. TaxID=1180 RepID=UPI002FFD4BFF
MDRKWHPRTRPQDVRVGKYFVLSDFLYSQTAVTRGIPKRMSEKFLDGIFCHSERNEVERRIPIFRYGWRCNTWLLLRWA